MSVELGRSRSPPFTIGAKVLEKPVTPGSIKPPRHSSVISYTKSSQRVDANRYATKKTIAQGMLDVALLTANASQLRYVLQVGEQHQFYTLMVTLITLSIALQVLVGILLMILGALSINDDSPNRFTADIMNDVAVILIFILTVINVVIAAFGIENTRQLGQRGPALTAAELRYLDIK